MKLFILILVTLTHSKGILSDNTKRTRRSSIYFHVDINYLTDTSVSFTVGVYFDRFTCAYKLTRRGESEGETKSAKCTENVDFSGLMPDTGYDFYYEEAVNSPGDQTYHKYEFSTSSTIERIEFEPLGQKLRYRVHYKTSKHFKRCYIANSDYLLARYTCQSTGTEVCNCEYDTVLFYPIGKVSFLDGNKVARFTYDSATSPLPPAFDPKPIILSVTDTIVKFKDQISIVGYKEYIVRSGSHIVGLPKISDNYYSEYEFTHLTPNTAYTLLSGVKAEFPQTQAYTKFEFFTAGQVEEFSLTVAGTDATYTAIYKGNRPYMDCFFVRTDPPETKYTCKSTESDKCSCVTDTITNYAGEKVALQNTFEENIIEYDPATALPHSLNFKIEIMLLTGTSVFFKTGITDASKTCSYKIKTAGASPTTPKTNKCSLGVDFSDLIPDTAYTFEYAFDTGSDTSFQSFDFFTAGAIETFDVNVKDGAALFTARYKGNHPYTSCFVSKLHSWSTKYNCKSTNSAICSCVADEVFPYSYDDLVLLDAKDMLLMKFIQTEPPPLFHPRPLRYYPPPFLLSVTQKFITYNSVFFFTGIIDITKMCSFKVGMTDAGISEEKLFKCHEGVQFNNLKGGTDYTLFYGEKGTDSEKQTYEKHSFSTADEATDFTVGMRRDTVRYIAKFKNNKNPKLCFIACLRNIDIKFKCKQSNIRECNCTGDIVLNYDPNCNLVLLDAHNVVLAEEVNSDL